MQRLEDRSEEKGRLQMNEPLRSGFDGAAFLAVIGWLSGWLPAIATLFTVVWTGMRCYEAWLDIKLKMKRNRDAG